MSWSVLRRSVLALCRYIKLRLTIPHSCAFEVLKTAFLPNIKLTKKAFCVNPGLIFGTLIYLHHLQILH